MVMVTDTKDTSMDHPHPHLNLIFMIFHENIKHKYYILLLYLLYLMQFNLPFFIFIAQKCFVI